MENKLVVCSKCGWFHVAVSRKEAVRQVNNFNNYFYLLTEKQREDLYGGTPANINMYESCFRCRESYKNFQDAEPACCPDGVTL